MNRTTSLRVRHPVNDVLIVNKGRKYKAFLVILALLLAYTVGSLHVFTTYTPPGGACTVTSFKAPDMEVVQLPPDKLEKVSADIAERWGVEQGFAKQIVAVSAATSNSRFPRVEDVLAITAIESGFDPKAVNAGAYGLMQIQYNHHKGKFDSKLDLFDPVANVKAGASILKEYYEGVNGDPDSAVLAYQAGLGGLFNGAARAEYLAKFKRERAWFKRVLRA